VLEPDLDLKDTFLDLVEGQAAAYYEPREDVFYLIATNVSEDITDIISSHELCHALQDQHFDLYALLEEDLAAVRDNGDATMAKQCLVEGDATLVMMIWAVMRFMGLSDPAAAGPMASMGVAFQAAMDFDAIVELAMAGAATMGDSLGTMGVQMADLTNHPRYLVEMLYSSYINGALMVDRVKSEHGWKGVNALYDDPPASTEQVLHPEKLAGPRDAPVDVRLPGLRSRLPWGWRLREEDVLGELGMRIYFGIWKDGHGEGPAPAAAAPGWGGDRYYYFTDRRMDRHLLVWKTVWDSEEDATEFAAAYRKTLGRRFPGMTRVRASGKEDESASVTWEVARGRFLKLAEQEDMVGIIDTSERRLLGVVW